MATHKEEASVAQDAKLAPKPDRQREVSRRVKTMKPTPPTTGAIARRGVVYLGHMPHGFAEIQVKKFFNQFGKVTRIRLSRSKRTGQPKGYGYVEFEYEEVAKIVANTMNNYLFYERLLKCEYIPPDKVHEKLFVGANRKFHMPTFPAVKRNNRQRTPEQAVRMTKRLLSKEMKKRKKLASCGIDYDFPGFAVDAKKILATAAGKKAKKSKGETSTKTIEEIPEVPGNETEDIEESKETEETEKALETSKTVDPAEIDMDWLAGHDDDEITFRSPPKKVAVSTPCTSEEAAPAQEEPTPPSPSPLKPKAMQRKKTPNRKGKGKKVN
ncbi:MKI67 FHA domain-interacting nucleolar phosphoprotein [Lampetra planeri]